MKVSENLSILFIVEKSAKSKDGLAPVHVRITVNGQRNEISLGVKILPEQWDTEKARVTGNPKEAQLVNSQITQARAKLEKLYLVLSAQFESVTPYMLKKAYQGKPVVAVEDREEKPEKKTLLEAFTIYISRFKEKVDHGSRAIRTLRKWNTTKDKVAAFLKHVYKKTDIPLESVKPSAAEDLYHYFTTIENLSHNSALKYLKNTRQVLKFAIGRWITTNPLSGYVCSYVQPNRDYLTMPEIFKLYHQPLSKKLDKIRDCFLFSCFTGLAYQELELLSPSDIILGSDGYKWVKIDRVKTGSPEDVPLLPLAEALVAKYKDHPECLVNDRLLPVISNQKYNQYLKEVASLCGIDKNITTHTGRHTFATTITLENGIPIETVSRMLAHKSIRVTQIYARITRKKVSENMQLLRQKLFSPAGKLKAQKQAAKAIKNIRHAQIKSLNLAS